MAAATTAAAAAAAAAAVAAAPRPTRSPCCCPTRSRRSAGRRPTGRSCSRRSRPPACRSTIQNAQGDKSTQQQQAEQAITNGAKVLLLVNLDSGSGAAIEANAKSQGVKVIDYDRLTLGGCGRLLRVVRQRRRSASSRARASSKCLQKGGGREAEHRRAQRLADGQQRDAVRPGLQLGPRPAVQGGQGQEGRRPVRAGLGQPEGADDLRADAPEGRATRSTACSPPTTASATRPSRRSRPRKLKQIPVTGQDATAAGHPEHPRRRPVHDRLQGDQAGGRRGRRSSRSRWPRADAGRRPRQRQVGRHEAPGPVRPAQAAVRSRRTTSTSSFKDGFLKKSDVCTGKYAQLCTAAGM